MAANRSSYINLYAKEDKSDNDYKVQMEVSQADFALEGQQDFALDFGSYQFSKMVSGSKVVYDLETRFDALESDATGANNVTGRSNVSRHKPYNPTHFFRFMMQQMRRKWMERWRQTIRQ